MSNLMQASAQWASRPSDERFTSLTALAAHCEAIRNNSVERVLSSRQLHVEPAGDTEHRGLQCVGPNGHPVTFSHWSFNQVASEFGGSGGYLRSLPAPLAADCLNYQIHHAHSAKDMGILLTKDDMGNKQLRAATGPGYGRIWNGTIANGLAKRFGDGVTGHWRVPGEFGKRIVVTKDNTTLYASDRDMFVFLADEERRITVPNRRDGKPGSLARGFFMWNSEVGSKTFGFAYFLFDYACSNRIVWGAQEYKEVTIRHSKSAPFRWVDEVTPAIESFATSSSFGTEQILIKAQAKKVEDLDAFLKARKFTSAQIVGVKAAHFADEQRPIESLWDVTTGVTAYARGIQYQDQRVDLERAAGKILQLAA